VLVLAAAAALQFSLPALAEDQSSQSQTQAQPAAPAEDGTAIQCRSEPAATGSRIGARRVCMTLQEWRDRESTDRGIVDQAQSSSLRAKMPGN
jgi:hypothetical protein